jgi:hypothetical protein
MRLSKQVLFVPAMLLALTACGSNELSLAEYMEGIDAAATVAGQGGDELFAEAAGMVDVTPAELQAFLERGREVRVPLQEAVDELSPPEELADLHDLMWDWHAEFITVEQAVAARVGETEDTAAGWEALSDSPELEAYRAALAEGRRLCTGFQAELDAISDIGGFSDAPWMPGELRGVVETALGCQFFPDRPEDVYRYP